MQPLRSQVDRIDLQILKLLQQRTKLSRRIGEAKRRHHGTVYVPERERELLRRMLRLGQGKMPPNAITAIYREILSSSRAAQGQGAIGLLGADLGAVLLPARECFGACDEFLPLENWAALAKGLREGSLALALLTGADLAGQLQTPADRAELLSHVGVAGDFISRAEPQASLRERIFILVPRTGESPRESNRILILIECKSTMNAVKSWLKSMPKRSIQAEMLEVAGAASADATPARLIRLAASPTEKLEEALNALPATGVSVSVLGMYGSSEDHAG